MLILPAAFIAVAACASYLATATAGPKGGAGRWQPAWPHFCSIARLRGIAFQQPLHRQIPCPQCSRPGHRLHHFRACGAQIAAERQSLALLPKIRPVVLVALMLAGCATPPGAEVLQLVSETAPGARTVDVFVATTREREANGENVFTANRSDQTNYATYTVSVPPNHQPGRVEWPQGRIDPRTTFAVVAEETVSPERFFDAIATAPGARNGVALFVHGYNQSFAEALYRLTQMTADADLSAAPVLFAWPSQAAVAGYLADRDSAMFSRDSLVDLLTRLARDRSVGEIMLMAHSMGGWLTVEALRQLRLSGRGDVLDRLTVVLASPDIDIDLFRKQMTTVGPLSPPMTILTSPDDRALLVSNRLSGVYGRVGALDVSDPRVQKIARDARVAIVDISSLEATDGFSHDRYVGLASVYRELAASGRAGPQRGLGIRQAGAFVFKTVGTTLSSPFMLVGGALAGE